MTHDEPHSLIVLRSRLLHAGASDLLACRHFDALLAERYMKWDHDVGSWWWTGQNHTPAPGGSCWDREWLPYFTTNRVEALRLLDHWPGDYQVARHNGLFRVKLFEPSREHEQWADTMELAICRAALASTI